MALAQRLEVCVRPSALIFKCNALGMLPIFLGDLAGWQARNGQQALGCPFASSGANWATERLFAPGDVHLHTLKWLLEASAPQARVRLSDAVAGSTQR